jgi:putative endonuclease
MHFRERPRTSYVYIMTNRSQTLYVGVTNNLERRVWQHKNGAFEGFTSKYKLDRLVYCEEYSDVRNAISREKQIKGWLRIKKLNLIVSLSPEWRDLSEEWGKPIKPLTPGHTKHL